MENFLIVGAGLSGCLISYRLLEQGHNVRLIDDGKNASSIVAAGQINPVTFRRMNLGWRTNECFDELEKLYPELENETGKSFFDQLTIRRFFAHQQEVDFWKARVEEAEYQRHLCPTTSEDDKYPSPHNTFGTGRIQSGAVIRPKEFIAAMHDYFKAHPSCVFNEEKLNYYEIKSEDCSFQENKYQAIIFSQGFRNFENPFFGILPVQCTKGQVLKLKVNGLSTDEALNRKCFLIPTRDAHFLAGSTYEWNQPNTEITEEAKATISENLNQLIEEDYQVVDQKAGVRPTTPDRRPLIGEHPSYPGLYIFNGLGTKGYSLAPLLSKEFVKHLLDGQPLPEEVSIHRFKKQMLT